MLIVLYVDGMLITDGSSTELRNIKLAFTPINTIRSLVELVKDSIDPRQHKGVYGIPCSYGEVYIGETKQTLQV